MKIETVLDIGLDCNAETLGDVIDIIVENKEMLFEYEDGKREIGRIIQEFSKDGFKMNDCISRCIDRYKRSNKTLNIY